MRILFTAWHYPGHYYPLIALAKTLAARGHEVAFYSGAAACHVIAEEGIRCFPFQAVDEAHVDSIITSGTRGSLEPLGLLRFRRTLREWLIGTLPEQVIDLKAVVERWQPDVVATDPAMFGSSLFIYEMYDLPVAIASFIPACTVPGPDVAPFGLGLPRPRQWHTRLLNRLMYQGLDWYAGGMRRTVNALREQHALSPLPTPSIYGYMGLLPLYLVPTVPELDYERTDLPPSVHYVGPYLWNRPATFSQPEWFEALPRDRPWIHISEGTMHNARPFLLQASVEGLRSLPVEVIMTTGGKRDPESLGLGVLPSNVHVARWISHSDLLPLTDVIVTTGGAGTVLASLHAGVPLVIVPTEWDKPEIAQRVVEAGVGVRIAPRRASPARIRAAVRQLLDDPGYRTRARAVAEQFAGSGGAERASDLIEQLGVGFQRVAASSTSAQPATEPSG